MFDSFLKQVDAVPDDGSVYADVVNHCKGYEHYLVNGSKTTGVHECTHGINADLRNIAGGQNNAFYVRKNRSIVIPEPHCRKSDAARFIPNILRLSRFDTYVAGQTDWDGQPLYLFDEWVAYTNEAYAAIELAKKGENEQADEVFGTLEFVAYITGVLMAANQVGINDRLVRFARWHLRQAFNAYFLGRDFFICKDEEEALLKELQSGTAWDEQRRFLKNKIGFVIPIGVEPEDDLKLDDFKVVGKEKLGKDSFNII